ncbi:hypothetical protein [Tichowtungia aerotolerans]|uniref:Uncharacterized protein n=1 Tax=Tichowtungia aerotolerans TaxID=2697043 RepID=A0A6P1MFT9_9BACT|nr:hypothetical protein [Tichowtungia aerotolerans]QHI70476.1 hypothetical protein GT409_13855 [Tichowtungia aerotolerans]
MWKELTVSYIESIMNPTVYASYQQWLTDDPDKGGRLADIIGTIATEYRSAMAANAAPVPSSPETAIHDSCVRQAQTTILFELKKEIGLAITEAENAAAIRADVFLRAVWMGSIPIVVAAVQSAPSYASLSVVEE